MRLFVGVWPSAGVRAAVAALPRPEDPRVRWTPPQQWHVTLRFLGEVDQEHVDETIALVRSVADSSAPVTAALGPATRILSRRVLIAPVAGLEHIAAALGEKSFTGHLTLARAAERHGRIPTELAAHPISGRWDVSEIALIRSHLGQGPARYETIFAGAIAP